MTINLKDHFTPDFDAFDETPEETIKSVRNVYTALATLISTMAREDYKAGDIKIEVMPVSKTRVMARLYGQNEDVFQTVKESPIRTAISEMVSDLKNLSNDVFQIYYNKDEHGYDVLSFEAVDMINVLKMLTQGRPEEQTYWESLDLIMHAYKSVSQEIGSTARHIN